MHSPSDIDIPYTLTLHPTMEEFSDFGQYWEKLEKEKKISGYGLVKVVPPKKWKPRAQPLKYAMSEIMVNSPIEQNVYGKGGIYELLLIQKKSMSLTDYRKKVEVFDAITDNKDPEDPPLYGADMKGSLFDDGVKWNLRELNDVLKEGLQKPIAGVNNPYLYVGSWKTMFGWHKEDIDLYSINYLHYGKPKFWYCLPASEGPKLEKFARQHFPEGFAKCKEYLRHKTIMISPYLLKQHIPDLKIHKMIHYPGEFMVTIGGAYHAGFNWGFNVAEAVNFATTRWLDLFEKADSCRCVGDSVKIDPQDLFTNLAKSSYKDHPTVRKHLIQHGIVPSSTKKSQDTMEIEKPRRRGSTPASAKVGAILEGESTEEESGIRSPSAENLPTRTSSRGHKKSETPIASKTRSGRVFHFDTDKSKKDQHNSTVVPKVSRSKKIQKREIDSKPALRPKGHSLIRKSKGNRPTHSKKDSDAVLIENWVQCDNCMKWRKITKKEVWKKVQNKKPVVCKDLPNLSCRVTEEEWKTNYTTVPNRHRVEAEVV